MTENELQKQCGEYIKKLGWEFLHLGYRGKSRHGYSANNTGYPDLIIFASSGKCFFVELKVGDGKLNAKQILKKAILENLGYGYYVCYNYQQFVEVIAGERFNTGGGNDR